MGDPIDDGYQMPPEWEPHTRCWMAWPCNEETFTDLTVARRAYAAVARAIARFEPVTMVANAQHIEDARARCGDGVECSPLELEDSWLRDTGPTYLIDRQGGLAGVDWPFNNYGEIDPNYDNDRLIARRLLSRSGARRFEAPITLEGGAIHTDGQGTLLTTENVVLNPNRNPGLTKQDADEVFRVHLGVEKVIWLDKALDIDGEYAPALVQKALVTSLLSAGLGSYGDIPEAEANAIARPLIDKAIALDENLAEAYAVSGLLMGAEENATPEQAIAAYEHALTLNPNLDNARTWLASEYNYVGRSSEARALYEAVVNRDPLFGPAFKNLIQEYLRTSDFDLGNTLIGRVERIVGETIDVHGAWGMVAVSQGETARAIRHLRRVYEDNPSSSVTLIWYGFTLGQIGEFETVAEIAHPIMKIGALRVLGRHDEARALLEPMSPVTDFNFILNRALYFYINSREYDEAVAYAEQHFDNLDALLEHFANPDGWNGGFMAPLAFSYLQVGRELEFKQLTDARAESLRQQRSAGANNNGLRFNEAELAALTGTDEEVLERARRLVDNDDVGVRYFESPIFDRMKENAEFQKLGAILEKRANDERAKLGLEPYQVIAETT